MIRALNAEVLKYKRTPTLLLALGVPALIVVVGTLATIFSKKAPDAQKLAMLHAVIVGVWASMGLPMGIAILAGQAVGMEDSHLKQVLVQPVSRLNVFLSKFLAVLGLVVLGSLVLVSGAALAAAARGLFDLNQWLSFTKVLGLMLLGALPLIILGVGLSYRFKWPVTMGSALLGTGVMGLALEHATAWKFLPWAYPLALAQPGSPQSQAAPPLIAVAFALFLILGFVAFARQEPR